MCHVFLFSRSRVSLAESLLRERMRSSHFSISDIKLDPRSGTFLISISGNIVRFTDHNWPLSSPCVRVLLYYKCWHCSFASNGFFGTNSGTSIISVPNGSTVSKWGLFVIFCLSRLTPLWMFCPPVNRQCSRSPVLATQTSLPMWMDRTLALRMPSPRSTPASPISRTPRVCQHFLFLFSLVLFDSDD